MAAVTEPFQLLCAPINAGSAMQQRSNRQHGARGLAVHDRFNLIAGTDGKIKHFDEGWQRLLAGNIRLKILQVVITELHLVKFVILPLPGQQVFMVALFHDPALPNHNDSMGVGNRR